MDPHGPLASGLGAPITARALVLGERIDTIGLERQDAISTVPLAVRVDAGLVVVFRYGVIVFVGLDLVTEDKILRDLLPRVQRPIAQREEETVQIVFGGRGEEGLGPDGVMRLASSTPEKLLIVATVLAKSAALAQDELHIAEVFDTVDPWARRLAAGRSPGRRRKMIRLVGSALLVQHRLTERVAVREKPDILWDRPDLERFYGRLESEYELIDRTDTLARKVDLIGETVTVMTDLIDAGRTLRLEITVVALILTEIVLTLWEMLHVGG